MSDQIDRYLARPDADDRMKVYNRARANDLDEHPAFEQGRSYLRDRADPAMEAIIEQLERAEWMLDTNIDDFDCAEMIPAYRQDLSRRYEEREQ